jgi:hypothetical protein
VDTTGKLLEKFGFRENLDNKESNLKTKLSPIEKFNDNQIRIHESIHTMGV